MIGPEIDLMQNLMENDWQGSLQWRDQTASLNVGQPDWMAWDKIESTSINRIQ